MQLACSFGKCVICLRLDSDTLEAIEKWAADEFSSVNGQIQWILDQALKKSGRLKPKQY